MKVLVTGASGFLGGHVVDELRARRHDVRVLVRSTSACDHLPADVERSVGALEDDSAVELAVRGVDAIVHAAGLVKARSEEEFHRVNVDGTARVIAAARRMSPRPKRIVLVSSVAAGGPTSTAAPRDPTNEDRPVTRYGRSKLEGERVALGAVPELPVTVLRPPVLYGPRDREGLPLYRAARFGLRFVFRGGVTHSSMLHARDCARAIADLLERDHASGRVYPVDDGEVHAVRDVVRRIAASVRRRTIEVPLPLALLRSIAGANEVWGRWTGRLTVLDRDKVMEFAGPCWVVGHEAITREVGWVPTIPLGDGIEETARWYRTARWL